MTDVAATTHLSSGEPHRLKRGVLTVPNGIAPHAGSGARRLLNAPAAGPVAGTALSLSFLLAFVACLGGGDPR